MNIMPIALALIAMQVLKPSLNNGVGNLTGLLNEDAKTMVDSIGTLASKEGSDKTSALLNVITNPSVISLASNFFSNMTGKNGTKTNSETNSNDSSSLATFNDNFTTKQTESQTADSQQSTTQSQESNKQQENNQTQGDNFTSTLKDNNIVDYENASNEAKQFFAPVSGVAGQEVSAKLYKMYDNWFSKHAN